MTDSDLVQFLKEGGTWGQLDMSKVRVLHGNILIRFPPIPQEIELSNGLIVPQKMAIMDKVWRIATVIAVGEDLRTKSGAKVEQEIKVGDKVLVDKIFGDVVVDGQVANPEYRIVSVAPNVQQIEAILDPETPDLDWINM